MNKSDINKSISDEIIKLFTQKRAKEKEICKLTKEFNILAEDNQNDWEIYDAHMSDYNSRSWICKLFLEKPKNKPLKKLSTILEYDALALFDSYWDEKIDKLIEEMNYDGE